MLRKTPAPQQHQLEMVTLEQLVPKDHLVRKVDAAIDFEFIREEVAHLYCPDNGRPPVDPVRLFKIMLLGYLFGIPSERRLVKEIEVNLAYRWFLRMSITEPVIDASTLSQNRIRRFNGTDVFERVFTRIVEQAMDKGLVEGRTLYTDSTHLKANANKNKYENKDQPVKPSAYVDALDQAVAEDRQREGKKALKPKDEPPPKATKVSTTDPQSGFMHRDQKPKGFFYLDHRTVDKKHNLILDTYVTPGNVNDASPYLGRLDATCIRFGLHPKNVGLDAGYFQASLCQLLEQRQIHGVFGYRRPHKGPNVLQKRDFTYLASWDVYYCPEHRELTYSTTSREGYRHYRANVSDCQNCPIKRDCTQSPCKVITRHVWEEAKDKAKARRLKNWAKCIYDRRKETVERSFADAKQHHGHRYARFRGLWKTQMQCLLAATAQNIKTVALLQARGLYSLFLAMAGMPEGHMSLIGRRPCIRSSTWHLIAA